MPRFVLLEHDHPFPHWDLMLEAGDVLRTWRLLAFPQAGTSVAAELSFDHRLIYLEYEGPVSGDRGCVIRRDAGEFAIQSESENELIVLLIGMELNGMARLLQETDGWRFQLTRRASEGGDFTFRVSG